MKKINTSPLSGTMELSPKRQLLFDECKKKIEEVYRRHGFLKIETPTIDRAEVLLAKAGGETEKQIYKVIKTEESASTASEALRFDHTVPLARYTVEHEAELKFPFKVSQIARNYRGERAQRGRYREFYQCDIDVIGRESLEARYDAEVILTLSEAYDAIGLREKIIRISNRKILAGLLEEMNLQEVGGEVLRIIDRAEKVSAEKTEGCLEELGLSKSAVGRVLEFIEISGSSKEVRARLESLGCEGKTFSEGVEELVNLLTLLEKFGECYRGDMKIVRGLDYYTGTVFETVLPKHREIGSIGGGGRYDNLVGLYSEKVMPGVGGSIGLTRLFYILGELGVLEEREQKPIQVAIIPVSENEVEFCLKLAQTLRADGEMVDVVLSEGKIKQKMKYAAALAERGIIIGEEEVRSGKYETRRFD